MLRWCRNLLNRWWSRIWRKHPNWKLEVHCVRSNAKIIKICTVRLYADGPIHKWAFLECPCGCGETIELPLSSRAKPSWRITSGPEGTPSLHPSIWRTGGCKSHFWLTDGQVRFVKDVR